VGSGGAAHRPPRFIALGHGLAGVEVGACPAASRSRPPARGSRRRSGRTSALPYPPPRRCDDGICGFIPFPSSRRGGYGNGGLRIGSQGEAVLGADDSTVGAQASEGLAERGIAGVEEIAERIAGERLVGEGGDHALCEIGDVLGMLERPGVDDPQVRSGPESELEVTGLGCGSGAMLDGEAERGITSA
jgi:hypothetical protein